MTISYSNFFVPTVLTVTAQVLYTVPAAISTTLTRGGRVRLTNTTGTAATVTLYAVPPAGSPAVGNAFAANKVVAANDYLDVDVPILPAGASLQALAGTASAITAHMISGANFQ